MRAAVLARRAGFQFVDVKHCHGYLGHELLRRPRPAGPLRRLASRTAPASCARSSTGIRAEAPGLRVGGALLGLRHGALHARTPTASATPERGAAGLRRRPSASSATTTASTRRSTTRRAFLRLLRGPGDPLGLRDRRQPVLQPPRAAARAVPAERRLPAARGPARGRGPPDPGHRPSQGGVPRPGAGRLGVQLPAGVAAARRPARGARGPAPTSSASAAWSSPTPTCRPTCSPAGRSSASGSAAPSATARPRPRKGLPSGCYPLDPFYAARPEAARLKALEGGARGMTSEPGDLRGGATRRWPLATAFLALFSIVGFALYGLPFFYDFFVTELGWTAPAGHLRQRLQQARRRPAVRLLRRGGRGPLRAAAADARSASCMAGIALIGLGGTTTLVAFYLFYLLNALGYVTAAARCRTRCCCPAGSTRGAGKAMGIAYLGIGIGGALVPLLAHALIEPFGWRIGPAAPRRPHDRDRLPRSPSSCASRTRRRASAAPGEPGRGGAPTRILRVLRRPPSTSWPSAAWPRSARWAAPSRTSSSTAAMDRGMAQGAGRAASSPSSSSGSIVGRLAHGLARRPLAPQAGDAARLPDRGRHRSRSWAAPSPATALQGAAFALRHRPRRRLHDHPAHGRRPLRPASAWAGSWASSSPPTAWPRRWCPWRWPPSGTAPAATAPASPCWSPWPLLGAVAVAFLARLQVAPERTELGRGRTYSTLGQQATPRGPEEGTAGGQGGAPRPARGRAESRRGDTTVRRGSRHRRHRPRPAAPPLGRGRADQLVPTRAQRGSIWP